MCGSRPAMAARQTGFPEKRHRARHVIGRGNQQPRFARSGVTSLSVNTAFSYVLRDLFSRIRRSARNAQRSQQPRRGIGIALAFQDKRASSAGDDDIRAGIATRQIRSLDEAVAATVQIIAATRKVDRALQAAAKHDDAIDISGRRRTRKRSSRGLSISAPSEVQAERARMRNAGQLPVSERGLRPTKSTRAEPAGKKEDRKTQRLDEEAEDLGKVEPPPQQ